MYTCMNLASQSSSSEVSGHGKKLSTTLFGSDIAGGDYLSTVLAGQLSKDKPEVLGMCIGTPHWNDKFILVHV